VQIKGATGSEKSIGKYPMLDENEAGNLISEGPEGIE
jgi:hypothetical protein